MLTLRPSVCPSSGTLKLSRKNKFQGKFVKIVIVTSEAVGLSVGIIDDTCLVSDLTLQRNHFPPELKQKNFNSQFLIKMTGITLS